MYMVDRGSIQFHVIFNNEIPEYITVITYIPIARLLLLTNTVLKMIESFLFYFIYESLTYNNSNINGHHERIIQYFGYIFCWKRSL